MEHLSKINRWHNTYLEIARLIGQHSHCYRNKVGAIIVKDNRIISTGYNGTPTGFDSACESDGVTKMEVLHAESNAIAKCAKSAENSNESALYVTVSPCVGCAKLIIQSGIKEVYFSDYYRETSGLYLLDKAKISYAKI